MNSGEREAYWAVSNRPMTSQPTKKLQTFFTKADGLAWEEHWSYPAFHNALWDTLGTEIFT